MVSSGIIRFLDFLIFFGYFLEYCLSCGEGSFFFFLFSVTFVSDVCLSIYYTCFLLCLLLVCWVRENFSGGPGHRFCVGLRCVECRAGTLYLSASLEWMAGLYRFSLSWLCCSGCCTVEMVGGWSGFPFIFFYFAVSSPGGRSSVVGFLCYRVVSLVDLWYFFAVSYFVSC